MLNWAELLQRFLENVADSSGTAVGTTIGTTLTSGLLGGIGFVLLRMYRQSQELLAWWRRRRVRVLTLNYDHVIARSLQAGAWDNLLLISADENRRLGPITVKLHGTVPWLR